MAGAVCCRFFEGCAEGAGRDGGYGQYAAAVFRGDVCQEYRGDKASWNDKEGSYGNNSHMQGQKCFKGILQLGLGHSDFSAFIIVLAGTLKIFVIALRQI